MTTSDANNLELRALTLLEAALEGGVESARAIIIENTIGEPRLRARALSILAAGDSATLQLRTGGALAHAPDEPLPEMIGGYRIEAELGRGGMGAVYIGRRVTNDFEHVAAIKVVRSDITSSRLIERLRAERRTLARLKHPNIAQMYDGGETEDGAPYFVMEHVPGPPLNDFLAENDVALDERLTLFQQVCDGISYAHRNLVIHRDLSPANILISDADHVKLIDFGISHSLVEDAAASAAMPQMTMTKGYAAPERDHGAPASTMTDIYSLGVILDEITQGLNAPRNNDLKAIVAKARADKPEDRYQTVDALAHDVRAYRRNEAVGAVNGGWAYHVARFIARQKLAVGAGAFALIAALVTGVVISALYFRAQEAEAHAIQRFDEVRELAHFVMFDIYDETAKLEGSTELRGLLAKKAFDYLSALGAAPGASDDLRLELAQGFKRLSDITGNPSRTNLGDWNDAEGLIEEASVLIEDLRQRHPDDAAVLRTFVDVYSSHALHEGFSNNNYDRAVALIKKAQQASEALLAYDGSDLRYRLTDASLNVQRGYFLSSLDRGEEAISQIKLALQKYARLTSEFPTDTNVRLGQAIAKTKLGEVMAWHIYFTGGEYDPAVPHFNEGVRELREIANQSGATFREKVELIKALSARSNTFCYMDGRKLEGIDDLAEAALIVDSLIEIDPANSFVLERKSNILSQRFDCYRQLGDYEMAVRAADVAIAFHEAGMNSQPDNPEMLRGLANLLNLLALTHLDAADWRKACDTTGRIQDVWARYDAIQPLLSSLDVKQREADDSLYARCAGRGFL